MLAGDVETNPGPSVYGKCVLCVQYQYCHFVIDPLYMYKVRFPCVLYTMQLLCCVVLKLLQPHF